MVCLWSVYGLFMVCLQKSGVCNLHQFSRAGQLDPFHAILSPTGELTLKPNGARRKSFMMLGISNERTASHRPCRRSRFTRKLEQMVARQHS